MKSEMSESTRRLAKVVLPLRQKEHLEAIKAAKAHLANDLSDHYRILGAELRIDKPPDPRKAPVRMIGVIVVDYGNRRNYEVLVGAGGKVAKVVDLGGAQPVFTSEEIEEAREIGERDPRVARLRKMKGSFVSEFGPDRAADNARRIGIRYALIEKGRVSRVLAHSIVDLSVRRLVEFEEASAEPGLGR